MSPAASSLCDLAESLTPSGPPFPPPVFVRTEQRLALVVLGGWLTRKVQDVGVGDTQWSSGWPQEGWREDTMGRPLVKEQDGSQVRRGQQG